MDRFDLEQNIMKCWNVTDDINLLYENVMDSNPELTTDQIANALLGMHQLYEMKFEKLFRNFEQLVKEGKIQS
jgi:hypothetical protein